MNFIEQIHPTRRIFMTSILEELWYGNICPNDASRKVTKEEKKIMGNLADCHDELFASLSDKQKELFVKFQDIYSELSCVSEREIFVYAFRLGAKVAMEIIGTDEE